MNILDVKKCMQSILVLELELEFAKKWLIYLTESRLYQSVSHDDL